MTYQIITLVGLALVSLAIFIVVSVLAWHDNVLLFRYFRLRSRQLLERWRDWRRAVRDPGYRQWRNTVRQYEDAATLILTLVQNERLHRELECGAEDERTRRYHRSQRDKFREAKLLVAPQIALKLVEFTDAELLMVAKHLVGFEYGQRPTVDDCLGPLHDMVALLKEQNLALKRNPDCVIAQLELLQDYCATHAAKAARQELKVENVKRKA